MENNNSNQSKIEQSLELSDLSIIFLKEITKWAKFLSILGFMGVAFMVIFALFVGFFISALSSSVPEFSAFSAASGIYSVVYLALAVVYAFPVYFLYKFSEKTRAALDLMDTELLTEGLRFLKSHYKFIGIMTIVIFALYAVILIVAIITGVAIAALS